MGKVEAYIAVELVLGSFFTPAIAEESLKEGSVYRNDVQKTNWRLRLLERMSKLRRTSN